MPTLYPTIKNKYKHAGTSQLERLLHTLAPEYFQLDDRSIKDILAATHRYAELLHFYNDQNVQEGDWTCFWKVETLTFLAVLSTIDTEAVGQEFAALEKEAKEGTEPIKKGYLNAILFLRKQLLRIDEYYHILPDSLPFKREMYHLIKKDHDTDADQLADTLTTLISYHKEAFQEVHGESLKHEMYTPFLTDLWSLGVVDAFYDITSSTDYRLDDWENLRQLAKTTQQAMARIKHRANYWFDKNLDTPQLRQPHVALYLAFLRLFEYARREMNDLTRRHLEFFYEQILHLRRQKAVPDDVHLLFQLANNVDQYLVEGGTTLLAGKLNGRNLSFATIKDWVFNKAQVAEIKNTYLDLRSELAAHAHVYASPDVKKVYKNNAEAENEKSVAWRSMGDDGDLPFGEIGFAIASSHLLLKEGRRIIDVYFSIKADRDFTNKEAAEWATLFNTSLKIALSSEKEWIENLSFNDAIKFVNIDLEDASKNNLPSRSERGFKFEVVGKLVRLRVLLFEDDLSVVPIGQKLKEEYRYDTGYPILSAAIDPALSDSAATYAKLRSLVLDSLRIEVTVIGIQENLVIENDTGIFSGLKEFHPFTSSPKVGKNFKIGSFEAFSKRLSSFLLNFDWSINPSGGFIDYYKNYKNKKADANSLFKPPSVNMKVLKDGTFNYFQPQVIAFLVNDKFNMREGDKIIIEELKKEGYSVYVASEFESIRSFEQKQLILISSNVDAKLVPKELKSLAVPIICWEPNLYDNLGMTGSKKPTERGKKLKDQVKFAGNNPDNLNAISKRQFDQLPSFNYKGNIPWGKVSSAATIVSTLEDTPDKATFYYYAAGEALSNGENAPQLRMGFFFWDDSGEQLPKDEILRQLFLDAVEFAINGGIKTAAITEVAMPRLMDFSDFLFKDNKLNVQTQEFVVDFQEENFRDINQERFSPSLSRGFANISLTGHDFLHSIYPNVLAALTGEMLQEGGTIDASLLPNPPIAPLLKGVQMSYFATQDIDLKVKSPGAAYIYTTPFKGSRIVTKNSPSNEISWVEPYHYFTHSIIGSTLTAANYFAPANLYLGLKDLTPGTNLSLLFQVKPGTEGSFEDLPPDPDADLLHWSYLAKDNQWFPFTVDQILKDTTRGLTRTGIVQLKLPFDMVKENTLLSKELHWIRIAAQEDLNATPRKTARALPSLVDVRAQAAEARFVPIEELPDHFIAEKPLAANSIKRLETSDSNVKKIEQPFPSFNGQVPEAGRAFYQRVSERLRHRDRAVTDWDYERIVLEQFPKVYRAKTLRHTDLVSELAPGHVLVALIPDLRQWDLEKPSKPRFSRGDLDEMADFLRSKTNFFVAQKAAGGSPYLHVENPIYEEIAVTLTVKFKSKVDEEYAIIQLNEALERFIAPWMYDPEQDIAFNRALDRSRLVQFIEMQTYVDAILELTLTHDGINTADQPLIVPFTSRSVLTTGTHQITPA